MSGGVELRIYVEYTVQCVTCYRGWASAVLSLAGCIAMPLCKTMPLCLQASLKLPHFYAHHTQLHLATNL